MRTLLYVAASRIAAKAALAFYIAAMAADAGRAKVLYALIDALYSNVKAESYRDVADALEKM